MVLPIIKYGHPILRKRGASIASVTPAVQQLIQDMLETMHAAAGIGLAAQQVGRAVQLTVIDVRAAKERPSSLEWAGQSVDPADYMPLVLLNPQLRPFGPLSLGPEGCLSFPELYADVPRPESVAVQALDQHGKPIEFVAGGLLGRAIQHEVDHLNGILFIDRMGSGTKADLQSELDTLQKETKAQLQKETVKA